MNSDELLKIRYELLKDLLALEVDYAIHLIDSGSEYKNFGDALNGLTQAYEYCDYYKDGVVAADVAEWMAVTDELSRIYDESGPDGLREKFWPLWCEHITQAAEKWANTRDAELAKTYCGFSYEFCPLFLSGQSKDMINLHFQNYFMPDSPFHHIDELKNSLREIVKKACVERPDVTQIQCGSWLNGLKVFRDLFGPSWRHFAGAKIPIDGTLGCWGQFIGRDGILHKPNAEKFRQTWQMQNINEVWYCDINELPWMR